jgi:hypothetical protein
MSKRFWPACALLSGLFLAMLSSELLSQESGATPGPSSRSEAKVPYVADLLDLVGQTKSVDAFLVTVSLLAKARPDARQVVPAVIRNAERLGIYGRYAFNEEAPGAEVAKQLTELLGRMSEGKANHVPVRKQADPGNYNRLFEKVHDVLGETFQISYANRFDGRIEGESQSVPGQPQEDGRRHRVSVQIQPRDNGGFALDVRSYSSLEGQPPARNEALERALRKKLEGITGGDGKN